MVDTLYLNRIEARVQDEVNFRYSWGVRAEMECDKFALLEHLAKVRRQDEIS